MYLIKNYRCYFFYFFLTFELTCWQRRPPRETASHVCPQTHSGQRGWDYSCAVTTHRRDRLLQFQRRVEHKLDVSCRWSSHVEVTSEVSFQLGVDDVAGLLPVKEQTSVSVTAVTAPSTLSLLSCFPSLASQTCGASRSACFHHHAVAL